MAILKVPRITTSQRLGLLLQVGEIVYDISENLFYGGDGATLGGFLIGSTSGNVEILTLTQLNIDQGQATLSIAPLNPSNTLVYPEGGIAQIYGIDYLITGNTLDWSGLGLDGFLEVGETLIIEYN